jgi:glycosyltransferase involved in cell wall biosynthesis
MKILHISGAKGWGGNEQQMMYILPELAKNEVDNLVFGINDSILKDKCAKLSISFVGVKDRKLNKCNNYSFLKNVIRDFKPDVLHLHTSDSLTFYVIARILFGFKIKTVFSKKGMGTSSSFLSNLKYNFKGLASIICVSNSVKRDLSKILNQNTQNKTVVVHDCVSIDILNLKPTLNLRDVYKIDSKFKVVGNIANHSNAKDLPTFINVVDEVVHKLNRKDIKFIQIGEFTKNTPELLQLVKDKGLEDTIIFTDKIENASSLVPQFDAFLMTSQREGGPTSVLEAMLLETPVVSTQVGVVPDVIQDGKNGFIAPVKDFKQLANKLLTLLDDENLKSQFVSKSKAIIENEFTAENIAKQTKEEYLRVMKL